MAVFAIGKLPLPSLVQLRDTSTSVTEVLGERPRTSRPVVPARQITPPDDQHCCHGRPGEPGQPPVAADYRRRAGQGCTDDET